MKIKIGMAFPQEDNNESMMITGRNLISGLPKTVSVTSSEVAEALEEPLQAIVEAVQALLERTPPELASDISERGIVMVGGGALLNGMDKLIQVHSKIPVHVMEDAVSCVALGTGRVLEALDVYGSLAVRSYARGDALDF